MTRCAANGLLHSEGHETAPNASTANSAPKSSFRFISSSSYEITCFNLRQPLPTQRVPLGRERLALSLLPPNRFAAYSHFLSPSAFHSKAGPARKVWRHWHSR